MAGQKLGGQYSGVPKPNAGKATGGYGGGGISGGVDDGRGRGGRDAGPRRPGGFNAAGSAIAVGGAIAMGLVCSLIWVGLFRASQPDVPAPGWLSLASGPLIGVAVGFGMKLIGQFVGRSLAWHAVAGTIVACVVGYLAVDQFLITWQINGQVVQPSLGDSLGRLINDIQALLLTAIGAWIAFAIARISPMPHDAAPPTDDGQPGQGPTQ